MPKINDYTMEFLVDSYIRRVDDWLDDPDEQFTSWSHEEFLLWYDGMLSIAADIGQDFWKIAKQEGTDYEIARAKAMLKVAGHPEFADEPDCD